MQKKIAVLIRDRQGEALRMAVGLTLMDDAVDVYVLDKALEVTPDIAVSLETLKELSQRVFTNCAANEGIEFCPMEELANRLSGYDHVLPY